MTFPAATPCCLTLAATLAPGETRLCTCSAELTRRAPPPLARSRTIQVYVPSASVVPRTYTALELPRATGQRRDTRAEHDARELAARTHAVVAELLSYARSRAWCEASAYGSTSSTGRAAEVLRLGYVGNGCSGTHPLASVAERAPAPPPSAQTRERLDALSEADRRTADVVMADGQGYAQIREETTRKARGAVEIIRVEHLHPVVVSGWSGRSWRELRGGLEVRVGWALVDAEQRVAWTCCVLRGDSSPATVGAGEVGERALRELTKGWGR